MKQIPSLISTLCTLITILHGSSAQEAYQILALNLHNQYRQIHHAPPLQMDNQLNSLAVQCAQYYVGLGTINHSCPYKKDAGENLAEAHSASWNNNQFAEVSTKMWYDESSQYNYNNPGFFLQTGHFTQLVWKSSQNFGFGYFTLNGYTVSVGLYSPSGNYAGQFQTNVLQP
ncbi:Golgi-associated plant pathogenesis-related protein 1-like [Bradysia coprophila]|uniref:Golgi-associated plant pathogenesis-related protein 1-like n=1 Tax=Bradysia coprophila TaxID=38358 RepID=UPI00187D788D|nr:Golgi-associated plant pathogenesis-related protein 1-like [Bradysia coprophila]